MMTQIVELYNDVNNTHFIMSGDSSQAADQELKSRPGEGPGLGWQAQVGFSVFVHKSPLATALTDIYFTVNLQIGTSSSENRTGESSHYLLS